MDAVYRYAEYHDTPLTEPLAFTINVLTQSDPFYIATLFRSDWPERDFSTVAGIVQTYAYEILNPEGELFDTWAEYINNTIDEVNDVYGKQILLYLSQERHQERTRDEIRDSIKWPPEKDRELEQKLRTFRDGDLIQRGHTNFHYQGIPDDVLDLIFRTLYQFEIDHVEPDVPTELMAKITALEDKNKSLQGALNELKGRMLEVIVWRELNACRIAGKAVRDFAQRLRPVLVVEQSETMQELVQAANACTFTTVWQNHYLQAPDQPASLQADVLAQGEDANAC